VNEPYIISNINDSPKGAPISKRKSIARDIRFTGGFPPDYWKKIESLINHIRKICQRIYISEIYIIINEIILTYRGRSGNITKLKNKLIRKNFKNWILADYGYIWR
jgi:hypothetical protein